MNNENFEQKFTDAYDKMMERVHTLLHDAEEQALPTLQRNIDKATQQAIELKEMTSDEAEKVAMYVKRDLHDAAEYLESSGQDFRTWLNFDLELVEQRMFDIFASVADKTSLELSKLASQAKRASEYHTGEITGIGTLSCEACGSEIHFKKTSRIPPCPKCHQTTFKRGKKK